LCLLQLQSYQLRLPFQQSLSATTTGFARLAKTAIIAVVTADPLVKSAAQETTVTINALGKTFGAPNKSKQSLCGIVYGVIVLVNITHCKKKHSIWRNRYQPRAVFSFLFMFDMHQLLQENIK
jgi:hypothetical protein